MCPKNIPLYSIQTTIVALVTNAAERGKHMLQVARVQLQKQTYAEVLSISSLNVPRTQ